MNIMSIFILAKLAKSCKGYLCVLCCVVLYQDKDTGFHRGFCWIGFTTEEGLNNALQKDPHILEGTKVNISLRSLKLVVDMYSMYIWL